MAEYCLDCWNKLNNENNTVYTCRVSDPDDLDLCEGCGQYKPIFISYRQPSFRQVMRYRAEEKRDKKLRKQEKKNQKKNK